MSELDRLRQAMRTTEPSAVVLDLGTIMRDGRRLRIRRRLVGTGAATLVAASVAAVALVGAGWGGPPPVKPPSPPVAVAPAPTATPTPTVTSTPAPTPTPFGAVVDTGIRYGTDQRVYFFVRVQVPGEPRVTMGLVGGRRTGDGRLTSDYLVNDVRGSDRSPGFHQIGCDESGSRATVPAVPTFGYFVGPAERIVGTVDGRQVPARLARWSQDPRVVIFWFDPVDLEPGIPLDGIVARDAANRRL